MHYEGQEAKDMSEDASKDRKHRTRIVSEIDAPLDDSFVGKCGHCRADTLHQKVGDFNGQQIYRCVRCGTETIYRPRLK